MFVRYVKLKKKADMKSSYLLSYIPLFLICFTLAGHNHALDYKEQTKHCCDGNSCPPRLIKSGRGYNVLNCGKGKHSKECSDNITNTTGKHRSSDDGRSNCVHLCTACMGYRAGTNMQEVDISTNSGKQSA